MVYNGYYKVMSNIPKMIKHDFAGQTKKASGFIVSKEL